MNRRKMTFTKRQREQEQKDRVRERAARREERKLRRAADPEGEPGEDPDLAGLVAGPQPKPDETE